MIELTWFELAIIVALAYAWGRWAQWRMTIDTILADPDKFINQLASRIEAKPKAQIELRAEWLGGHCYLYRKDTDEFVGQGVDVEAAINNAHRLVPDTDYVISREMVKKPQETQP